MRLSWVRWSSSSLHLSSLSLHRSMLGQWLRRRVSWLGMPSWALAATMHWLSGTRKPRTLSSKRATPSNWLCKGECMWAVGTFHRFSYLQFWGVFNFFINIFSYSFRLEVFLFIYFFSFSIHIYSFIPLVYRFFYEYFSLLFLV